MQKEFERLYKAKNPYHAKHAVETFSEEKGFYYDDRIDEAWVWFKEGYKVQK